MTRVTWATYFPVFRSHRTARTHLIALAVVLQAARPLAVTPLAVSRLHVPHSACPDFWLESFRISIKTSLGQKMQSSTKG